VGLSKRRNPARSLQDRRLALWLHASPSHYRPGGARPHVRSRTRPV